MILRLGMRILSRWIGNSFRSNLGEFFIIIFFCSFDLVFVESFIGIFDLCLLSNL
jgi:hypothetical protein